jgi:hypothetical protein
MMLQMRSLLRPCGKRTLRSRSSSGSTPEDDGEQPMWANFTIRLVFILAQGCCEATIWIQATRTRASIRQRRSKQRSRQRG